MSAHGSINIADIRINGGTQSRASIDRTVVADYAEAVENGSSFPPITVFFDGADYWLADGFHRYEAYSRAKVYDVPADVRQGTQRDAILFSVGANASHGLRRTNDDKRRAVSTLLNDAEWASWSDREIARQCGVGAPLVGSLRKAICNPITDSAKRTVTRNGTTFQQNTAKIGAAASPVPAPAASENTPVAQSDGDVLPPVPPVSSAPLTAEEKALAKERAEIGKLTTDGMIDLIIGLRGDLAEVRAKAKAAGAEVVKLKALLALHTSDKDKAIAKLSRDLEHKSSEMFRANDNADVWARKAKKLTTEVEKLRKQLSNQLVPL